MTLLAAIFSSIPSLTPPTALAPGFVLNVDLVQLISSAGWRRNGLSGRLLRASGGALAFLHDRGYGRSGHGYLRVH